MTGQKIKTENDDKTNAARARQDNKKQEKNLVCDHQKPMKALNIRCTD